jgi:predicted RNase H-like HicB family nuclease
MQTIINLKIEKFEEKGKEYFVATSDELQGLVAEGETIDKTIEIAKDLACILLELDREKKEEKSFRSIPSTFNYPLIVEV